jgi:ribonuclease BN (tRNA processing enzyme)
VRLTVLGCAGTWPAPQSGCSSYLVEQDGFRLLLDVGNGAVGALQRVSDLLAVDAVLLSHLHADHCLDLVAYSYARRYHPEAPFPPIPVYGPAGTLDRLLRAFDHPPEDSLRSIYDVRTVTAGSHQIGPFAVQLAQMFHPVETYAVRLTAAGRSLTYSADTGVCPELVKLADGSDLLLCEATWPDNPTNPPGLHLSGREAGEHGRAADVAALMLTHLAPTTDPAVILAEAAGQYDGELSLAEQDRALTL